MFCKLVVRGADRQAALDRAVEALDALEIEGVTTTAGLHRRILALPAFRAGDYDTTTLESTLTPPKEG
jgi:acetyl-CoA carboxylase biotin carboxylase subunit